MAIFGFLGIKWWAESYFLFFAGGFTSLLVYIVVFLLLSKEKFWQEIKSLKKNI
jgi:hypothetical protein